MTTWAVSQPWGDGARITRRVRLVITDVPDDQTREDIETFLAGDHDHLLDQLDPEPEWDAQVTASAETARRVRWPQPAGRPAIGPAVQVRLPREILQAVEQDGALNGEQRSDALRRLITTGLAHSSTRRDVAIIREQELQPIWLEVWGPDETPDGVAAEREATALFLRAIEGAEATRVEHVGSWRSERDRSTWTRTRGAYDTGESGDGWHVFTAAGEFVEFYAAGAPVVYATPSIAIEDTGYLNGEPFETDEQVREYFTLDNMRVMFGDEDAAAFTQARLDEWAEQVIETRDYMVD